jgi:hypothetical protein
LGLPIPKGRTVDDFADSTNIPNRLVVRTEGPNPLIVQLYEGSASDAHEDA